MPTRKQLAARKLFAQRARAGTFTRQGSVSPNRKRKRNPDNLFSSKAEAEAALNFLLRHLGEFPFVKGYVATLGGEHRASVLLTVSLDPRESWANGILENSQYGKFSLSYEGKLEHFSGYGLGKMRMSRASSVTDAGRRLREFLHKTPMQNPHRRRNPSSGIRSRIIYKCRCHSKPYTVCKNCQHQYCSLHWSRGCPSCSEKERHENPIEPKYGAFKWHSDSRYKLSEAIKLFAHRKTAEKWIDKEYDEGREYVMRELSYVQKNPIDRKIYISTLPQSSGKILYGARVGGRVIAHGYKTRAAAVKDAKAWKRKHIGKNPITVAGMRKGFSTAVRTGKRAVQRGRNTVKGVQDALKGARDVYRALHPGKPLPPSLASKKKRRQKNPIASGNFFKGSYNYRTEANGPLKYAERFSYESAKNLYDVIQLPQGTVYMTNGRIEKSPDRYHVEVIKHFSLIVKSWHSELIPTKR